MVSLPAAETAYILAAIALISGLISGVSPFIAKIPAMADANLYAWTLRALNFVLNFGAVILSEVTLHSLNWQNWLAYVTVAGGASVGAHVLYHLNTTNLRTQMVQSSSASALAADGKNSDKAGVA